MPEEVTCKICGRCGGGNDLRMGACWYCVEAESILDEGRDMYDNGPDGTKASHTHTPMERLKFLIQKGWHIGHR